MFTPTYGPQSDKIYAKILIQGEPKTGKSLNSATTSPNPLILDFKEGWDRTHSYLHPEIAYRAYGPFDADSKNPRAYQQFASEWPDIKKSNYDTLIFDSFGSFQDAAQALVEAEVGGQLQIQHWGRIKNLTNGIIEEACALPKNIIVIAHERAEYTRPKTPNGKPDLNAERILTAQTIDCIGDRDRATFQKHFDIYCRAERFGTNFKLLMAPVGTLKLGHRYGTIFSDREDFNITGLINKVRESASKVKSTAKKEATTTPNK